MTPLFTLTDGAAGPFAALAPPASAPARQAPDRAQVERALLDDGPAAGYAPTPPLGAYGGLDYDTPPPWRFFQDLYAMLRHPRVSLALQFYKSGISNAKFLITASSPAVQRFAEDELARFWNRSVSQVQVGYEYGWVGCQSYYTVKNGLLCCDFLEAFEPRDVQPLLGSKGEYVGFRLGNVPNGRGHADFWGPGKAPPKGFWYQHQPRRGWHYGRSQVLEAWRPWRRVADRNGAEEVLDKAFHQFGYPGLIGRFPANDSEEAKAQPPGPPRQSSREKMQAIGEQYQAGSPVALSSRRDPVSGEYVWDIQVPERAFDGQPILNYLDALCQQIDEGVGVPSELLEASETGSGYSGRMIPLEGYFLGQQTVATSIVKQFKEQVLDPLVKWNFGRGAWFDADVQPLLETRRQASQPQGPPPGSQPDGAQPPGAQSAQGGDSYPQIGPRGGHYQVNALTGAKRPAMLSAGEPVQELLPAEPPRLGCALLELPPALADKVRALAAEIPAEDLAGDGREDKPHVTARFGFLPNYRVGLADDIASAVRGMGPIELKLGPTGVFAAAESGADYDVVYVSIDSPALHALNRLLADVPHVDTHPRFCPHVTLAYVQPGRGLYYAGDDDLDGETATLDTLTVSDGSGRRETVKLDGSVDAVQLATGGLHDVSGEARDESGKWTAGAAAPSPMPQGHKDWERLAKTKSDDEWKAFADKIVAHVGEKSFTDQVEWLAGNFQVPGNSPLRKKTAVLRARAALEVLGGDFAEKDAGKRKAESAHGADGHGASSGTFVNAGDTLSGWRRAWAIGHGSGGGEQLATVSPSSEDFELLHPRAPDGKWTEADGRNAVAARDAHRAAMAKSGGKAATPEHWRTLGEHARHLSTQHLQVLARRLYWVPRGRELSREQILAKLAEQGRKRGLGHDADLAAAHAADEHARAFDRSMEEAAAGEHREAYRLPTPIEQATGQDDPQMRFKDVARHGKAGRFLATGAPFDESKHPRDDEGEFAFAHDMYHGTKGTIPDVLRPPERGGRDAGNLGKGVYFTPHRDIARWYAGVRDEGIIPHRLKLKKPLVITGDKNKAMQEAAKSLGVKLPATYDGNMQTSHEWAADLTQKARQAGHDGIVWRNHKGGVEEAVSFDPVRVDRGTTGSQLAAVAPYDESKHPRDAGGQWSHVAGLDAGEAAERHHANHLALHAAGHALRADASVANVQAYRQAYHGYKAGLADLKLHRSGVTAARAPAIHSAVRDLTAARQAHAQARADHKGVRAAIRRVKRAEAAVDALKNHRAKIVGYKHAQTGEWTRFFAHHPDGTVTYHDRRPEPAKPAKAVKPKAEKPAAKPERQPGDEPGFDFDHPADTSAGKFDIDYSPPAVWSKRPPVAMTARRKEWALKANAEGVDARDLHQYAAELMAKDWEAKADERQMLKEARDALAEFGGQGKALHLLQSKHGKDAAGIKGIDEVAEHAAKRYPGLFGDAERGTGHATDRLFDLLVRGSPPPMDEDDAYETALEQLREHAEHARHAPKAEHADEGIPFATDPPEA